MKVLQLSTSVDSGGAAIAAYRLHTGLNNLGVNSEMLVAKSSRREPGIVPPSSTLEKLAARLLPVLDRLPGKLSACPIDRLSSSWLPDGLRKRVNVRNPDILNLHWVNDGFMRIETLPKLGLPMVWTLHDMWAFAGGEHYVGEIERYKTGYQRKNRPADNCRFDVNRWIWERKFRAWRNLKELTIVCPSRWLADCVRNSRLFQGFRVEVLPNGVDHKRFLPMEHATVRRILGLPLDKKLILFGAGSATSDRRKGYHLLLESLNLLNSKDCAADYELVVFGASSGADSLSLPAHYLGSLRDEISMALVYAACDVFVAPSLEDNLPNTVLESLSCGTPVVAFDIGGFPDMVTHKESGYLATGFDTSDLANGIDWVTADEDRWKRLAETGRARVLEEFTLERSANRYNVLYRELLGLS